MIRCPERSLTDPTQPCAIEQASAGELAAHLVEQHMLGAADAFKRAQRAREATGTSSAPPPLPDPEPA